MWKKFTQTLQVVFCGLLVVQLTGCGTLLYPERRGQRAGHVDAGVAILDGIGLFFFIIPGVIAFAVDFSNGTIYLPATAISSLDIKDIKQVKFDPKHGTQADIERMIKEQTGQTIKWDQPDMQISKLRSTNDMVAQFAQIMPQMKDERIALNHLTGEKQ
jgi:hypothetical protein